MSFVLVVGSAHLDVLSTIVGDIQTVDKIGKLSIHFGGTAYNIAINLSNLGETVRFASGMKRSPFTSLILDNLKEHNIESWVLQQENVPLGGFCAQLWNGELISAVSSMPVEQIHFDQNFLLDVMDGAKAVILECNLSPIQLQHFANAAKKQNIPVFLSAVSEEKSLRLKMLRAPIEYAFMNRKEAQYIANEEMKEYADFIKLRKHLKYPCVVTLSKDGALDIRDEVEHVPASIINRPEDGNYLGAGDLLLSLTIHEYLKHEEKNMRNALSYAMENFPLMAFQENCNLEETGLIEKRMEDVDRQAKYDGMTGLHNRRTGEVLLESEISRMKRKTELGFSLMIFDIDHFKSVNDTWGHDVGDDVIRGVARCFIDCIRPHDVAARWGGEEFVCILPNASLEEAGKIAERLRAKVESSIHEPRVITISIGVAPYIPGITGKKLVENADAALYYSKRNGRNKVTIFNDIHN